MQNIIWQDISFFVPSEWEMLKFSSDYMNGSCSFADKYEEKLVVIWQRSSTRIDMDKAMLDRKLADKEYCLSNNIANKIVSLDKSNSCIGYYVEYDKQKVTKLWKEFFNGSLYTYLLILMIWNRERDVNLEQMFSDSINQVTVDDYRRLKAFGLDLLIPTSITLTYCNVYPAVAEMRFATKDSLPKYTVKRLGMPSIWLKMPINLWLKKQLPKKINIVTETKSNTQAGHELCLYEGNMFWWRKKASFPKKIWRREIAWLCPKEQRVYHIIRESVESFDISKNITLKCVCEQN